MKGLFKVLAAIAALVLFTYGLAGIVANIVLDIFTGVTSPRRAWQVIGMAAVRMTYEKIITAHKNINQTNLFIPFSSIKVPFST